MGLLDVLCTPITFGGPVAKVLVSISMIVGMAILGPLGWWSTGTIAGGLVPVGALSLLLIAVLAGC